MISPFVRNEIKRVDPAEAGAGSDSVTVPTSATVPGWERLQFEVFLAELSATFVRVPPDQVDSQIVSALRQIVEFLGIDRSGLGELSADGTQLAITHSYELPGVAPSPRIIVDERMPWYAGKIFQGEVLKFSRLPDELPSEAIPEREFCVKTGLKSQLTIPLMVVGSVVGGIGFASVNSIREWPDELVQRLRLVGDIFTNALARKRADEALRALAAKLLTAQEEERRRVAREMHDDWTQRLAVMSLDLAKMEQHVGDPEATLSLLRTMQEQLVDLSEAVHALSRQLHPSILDDLGLAEALRSECASFSRRENIVIDYRAEAVPQSVPKDIALCVYRVAQEALRNLAKHAAVREAWVTLAATGQDLVLSVRDEGIGFDASNVRTEPGLGLVSMAERVRLVRARMSLTSKPGRGTIIEVRAFLAKGNP